MPGVDPRVADFDRWLQTAVPGESYTYWRGNLCVDQGQQELVRYKLVYTRVAERVWELGVAAARAYHAGLVTLVQIRRGEGDYEYQAIRLRHGRPVPRECWREMARPNSRKQPVAEAA